MLLLCKKDNSFVFKFVYAGRKLTDRSTYASLNYGMSYLYFACDRLIKGACLIVSMFDIGTPYVYFRFSKNSFDYVRASLGLEV